MDSSGLCETAQLYSESRLIAFTHYAQIILAILCLFSIAINIPLKCWKQKPVALHQNLKIIIYNAVFLYIVHSLAVLSTQLMHQIKFHTFSNPCDLLIEYWKCAIFKIGIHCGMVGFTLFHVMLCFERSMAVLRPAHYETTGIKFGFVIMTLMYLIIICSVLYGLIGEDFSQQFSYCNLTTATNGYKWTNEFTTLMVVDIIVLTVDITITFINRKSLKKRLSMPKFTQKFLGHAYQLNENARAMSIILPISIAHSIFYLIYLSSTVLTRLVFSHLDPITFRGLIECFACLYTVVIPLLYFRLRKNLNPKKTKIVPKGITETEMYFKMLNDTLNSKK